MPRDCAGTSHRCPLPLGIERGGGLRALGMGGSRRGSGAARDGSGSIPRKEEAGRWMDWAGDENEEVAADGTDRMDGTDGARV